MSNTIQETLRLDRATIIDLSYYPGEKGINAVMVFKAPLTVNASKVLGCEERFYTLNETAYTDFQGRITLKKVAKACKVMIGEMTSMATALLPDMIWKFSIGLEKDSKPSVVCRMHFDGQWRQVLVDMIHALNKDEFTLNIAALQQHLFIEEEPVSQEGDGTRVDLSGSKQRTLGETDDEVEQAGEQEDVHCVHCDGGQRPDEDTGKHGDEPCAYFVAAQKAVAEIPDGGSTLASSLQVVGGTTAAARKERKQRHAAK